jgi:DNA-binding NarL/FixJ family response regulator
LVERQPSKLDVVGSNPAARSFLRTSRLGPTPSAFHPLRTCSEVLRLLEHGHSTKQIAAELTLSQETVRNHVRHVLHALGVHSRLEGVALARREQTLVAG